MPKKNTTKERVEALTEWLIRDEQGESPEPDYAHLRDCRTVAEVMCCSVVEARALPPDVFEFALIAARAEGDYAKFEAERANQLRAVAGR